MAQQAQQRAFSSPEETSNVLVSATQNNDETAMIDIPNRILRPPHRGNLWNVACFITEVRSIQGDKVARKFDNEDWHGSGTSRSRGGS